MNPRGAYVWLSLLVMFTPPVVSSQPLARVPASTLELPAEPPSRGFRTERALGSLSFDQPVAIVAPPGETNRLFVVEKPGRIMIVPDLGNPAASVFLDIRDRVGTFSSGEQGLL
ncbi:MAG: hypothetical protein ACREIA_13105, partial [Opitutaceae bacterium]